MSDFSFHSSSSFRSSSSSKSSPASSPFGSSTKKEPMLPPSPLSTKKLYPRISPPPPSPRPSSSYHTVDGDVLLHSPGLPPRESSSYHSTDGDTLLSSPELPPELPHRRAARASSTTASPNPSPHLNRIDTLAMSRKALDRATDSLSLLSLVADCCSLIYAWWGSKFSDNENYLFRLIILLAVVVNLSLKIVCAFYNRVNNRGFWKFLFDGFIESFDTALLVLHVTVAGMMFCSSQFEDLHHIIEAYIVPIMFSGGYFAFRVFKRVKGQADVVFVVQSSSGRTHQIERVNIEGDRTVILIRDNTD